MGARSNYWWEWRATVVALVLITIIPLIWPTIPPLIDLPGHMARYRVQLDYDTSAVLRNYYSFTWALIGNLGVDLLIIPMAKIFGLELGVKLIVIAIPALTVAGLLWIAREVHGRIPPTAIFALPFAYGHPFMFGFVNFALSMGLALCAFALWLRMARLGSTRLRAIVFVPISIILWVCHTYGWGTLGVLAFSAELIRQHDRGGKWIHAAFHAGLHCLCMSFPVILMIMWRSGAVSGMTGDYFNWEAKLMWLNTTLRDRWRLFDAGALMVAGLLLFFAVRDKRLSYSRNLAASTLFLVAVFILLPRIVFGSAYADMRLTPYMFAIGIIAIRLRPQASPAFAATLAILGLIFFGARTIGTTASFAIASRDYDRALGALDHVPYGARLVSFVGIGCDFAWVTNRMEHLPGIAVVRRHAFSNDQWDMLGGQLLHSRYPKISRRFHHDPSQMVTAGPCPHEFWRSLDLSFGWMPRDEFDYIWLIAPPPFDPKGTKGMTRVWFNGRDSLYRIDHPKVPPAS